MPTIADVVNTAIPAGMTLAQWAAANNSLGNATGTVNAGVTKASSGLDAATQAAIDAQNKAQANTAGAAGTATIAQQEALAKQLGLYQTTVDANAPYQATGTTGNTQLQGLIADPSSLSTTPGYQFELGQGLQGQQRQEAAQGSLGNGGTIKAATRYVLDYANTKYNDAVQRLLQVTNVGQTANAADQRAGEVLGQQVGTGETNIGNIATGAATQENQALTNIGNIGTTNAENQAGLTLAQAELNANNQVAQGQNTTNLIKGLTPTIAQAAQKLIPALGGAAVDTAVPTVGAMTGPTLAELGPGAEAIAGLGAGAAGAGTAAAGEAAAIGAESAAGAIGPAIGAAGTIGGEAGAALPELGSVGSGGLSSTVVSALQPLLSVPVLVPIAAAIGTALIWKATQTHPVASTFVSKFQDPFVNTKGTGQLNKVVDAFDKSIATGQMTKAQGQAAYQQTAQLIQGFLQDTANFAKKGDKEASVANQALRTMAQDFGGTVDPTGHNNQPDFSKILSKMQNEISALPDQVAA